MVTSDIRWLDPRSYPCSKLRPKGQLLRHSSRYGTINEILVLASACHATVAAIHAHHTSIQSTYNFIYTLSIYEREKKTNTKKRPGIFRELNERRKAYEYVSDHQSFSKHVIQIKYGITFDMSSIFCIGGQFVGAFCFNWKIDLKKRWKVLTKFSCVIFSFLFLIFFTSVNLFVVEFSIIFAEARRDQKLGKIVGNCAFFVVRTGAIQTRKLVDRSHHYTIFSLFICKILFSHFVLYYCRFSRTKY